MEKIDFNKIYNSREELINVIRTIIDMYLNSKKEIDDYVLINILSRVFLLNKHNIINNKNEYFFEFKRELGKKRMRIFQYALEKYLKTG